VTTARDAIPAPLAYDEAGRGPAVLLVHGLAGGRRAWRAQMPALAERYRVIAIDIPGHGDSPAPRPDFTLRDVVAALVGQLDRLGIARAAVVGHSLGGVLAQQLTLDYPDRVWALALVATSSQCNAAAKAHWEQRARLAAEQGVAAAHSGPEGATARVSPAVYARYARLIGCLYESPLTSALASVRVPTLVVAGEQDPLGMGGPVILQRSIPGARLAVAPGAGHYVPMEQADWFNAELLALLDAAAAGAA
jgi:pimeloyl-ACP methyl ester carboxylesterase